MNNTTTTDLAKFGYRERAIGEALLAAWRTQGLPEGFNASEVTLKFNADLGSVFLTNSEFQDVAMNDEKLEIFYSCPICGYAGFKDQMQHNENVEQCQEYLQSIEIE